jgi:hypothetical protein
MTLTETSFISSSLDRRAWRGLAVPGTKGLSLFVVPKFHFDLETGELTGERNGVFATNLEKKMASRPRVPAS